MLLDDVPRHGLVHVRMRVELENQVQDVNEQQDHAGSAANLKDLLVRLDDIAERGMERCLCHVSVGARASVRGHLYTGSNKLETLKLRRQALICVTVLL